MNDEVRKMLGRRNRPQRKIKKINLSEEDFLNSINEVLCKTENDPDILEQSDYDDIITDLYEINNMNTLLQQHSIKFIERLFYGNVGVLMPQQSEQPKAYSFITSQDQQLDYFLKSYINLLLRFPILQELCEQILEKTLTSSINLDDKLNKQIYIIIAKMLKYNIYKRNKKMDFFILGAIQQQRLTQQISDLLNTILEIYGKENTFNLLSENNFMEKAKESYLFDYDVFIQNCQWIQQFEQQIKEISIINQAEPECVKLISQITKETTDDDIKVIKEKIENIFQYRKETTNEQKLITAVNILISGCCSEHSQLGESEASFKKLIFILKDLVQTIPQQGLLLDQLSKTCYQNIYAHDRFKPFLFILYNNQIIDGNVIVAWCDRSREIGSSSFGKQLQQFVQWLKED